MLTKLRIAGAVGLFLVGLINILPAAVAFAPEQAVTAYGVDIGSEGLSVLMRHRAVLLGLLGIALVYAAFEPRFRIPVVAGAYISKVSFLILYSIAPSTPQIRNVLLADVVAMVVLLLPLIAEILARRFLPKTEIAR